MIDQCKSSIDITTQEKLVCNFCVSQTVSMYAQEIDQNAYFLWIWTILEEEACRFQKNSHPTTGTAQGSRPWNSNGSMSWNLLKNKIPEGEVVILWFHSSKSWCRPVSIFMVYFGNYFIYIHCVLQFIAIILFQITHMYCINVFLCLLSLFL